MNRQILCTKLLFFSFALLILTQCTFSSEKLLEERADRNFEEKNYVEANYLYEKLAQQTEDKQKLYKAWKKVAEINHYHLKDGDQAHLAYKKAMLYSQPGEDLISALKLQSDLEINLMQRPDLAITSLERLALLQTRKEEKIKTLVQLARIYQDRRLWDDAKMTIQQVLELGPGPTDRFHIELTKASLLNKTKNYEEELKIYEELLAKSPELSRQNRTALQLVLALEQRKQLKEALQALQKWKEMLPEEMVREKELELKKRISNEPGARGLRK